MERHRISCNTLGVGLSGKNLGFAGMLTPSQDSNFLGCKQFVRAFEWEIFF